MFTLERRRYLTKELADAIKEVKEKGLLDSFEHKMTFISKISSQSLISQRSGIEFESDQSYQDFMEVVLYDCPYSLKLIYINVMKRFGGEEFLTERLDENGNVVVDENGRIVYDSDCFQNAKAFTPKEIKELAPEYQNEGFYVTTEEAEELYGTQKKLSPSSEDEKEEIIEEIAENTGLPKKTIEAAKVITEAQRKFQEKENLQEEPPVENESEDAETVMDIPRKRKRNKLYIK